jgi:hypothetical protein
MKYNTLILLGIVFISSCQPVNRWRKKMKAENKIERLSWLLGKWEYKTADGTITEEWIKPSDTELNGKSFLITPKGDTPFHENIRLSYNNERLSYLPTVPNQNEGKEVSFMEKSFSDSLIIFENKNHDFPQRIIYKRLTDSSLLAAIEGDINGERKREEFSYVKAK